MRTRRNKDLRIKRITWRFQTLLFSCSFAACCVKYTLYTLYKMVQNFIKIGFEICTVSGKYINVKYVHGLMDSSRKSNIKCPFCRNFEIVSLTSLHIFYGISHKVFFFFFFALFIMFIKICLSLRSFMHSLCCVFFCLWRATRVFSLRYGLTMCSKTDITCALRYIPSQII